MSNNKNINQDSTEKISIGRRLSFLNSQITYLILVIIIVGIIATALNPNFLTLRNFFNIMQQVSVLGILTMCMSLLMISGGLDISIGNMAGLVAMIFAKMLIAGKGIPISVITVLAIALILGFINGLIIAKSKVTPLIITLGMNYVFLGVALIIGGGRPQTITGQFEFLGEAKIGPVPVSIIIYLLILLFAFFLRKNTKYGRRLNAIGGNTQAAFLSGINVDWHIISIYALSGLIVGLAGLVLVSRLGMVRADSGSDFALQALAAAIIGGITFEGGRGSLVGAFFGVLLLGILYNAMNIIGVNSYVQTIILGAIIVVATVVSNIGKMRR
ncbi:MAG: ABC transporter permease [Actinobacteria bacterium]|nr:ABC transporter permease [Cyanobacteriota bacterium]MCL5772048.1 ABC transporter permease [Actinomycetota bacterium]